MKLVILTFWDMKPTFKNVSVTEIQGTGFVVPGNFNLANAMTISESQHTFNYTQPMNSIDISVGVGISL